MLKRVFDRFLSDSWYLCSAFILCLLVNFITARKQSLGQGKCFHRCLSVHRWCTSGSWGCASRSRGCAHPPWTYTPLDTPWTPPPLGHTPSWTPPWTPPTVNSGRYASYWNAFLWCDETTTI